MTNTRQNGFLTFFIYFDKQANEFVGLCIELGIIKIGNDPEQLKVDLETAAKGYVMTVAKNNLSEDLLNQSVPEVYMNIYKGYLSFLQKAKGSHFNTNHDMMQAEVFTSPVYA